MQIREGRTNVSKTFTLQDDWDDESDKSDTEDGNTQANVFANKSQMYGKKRTSTKVSKEDLTSEIELDVMTDLRDIFAENRKRTNETEENKEYTGVARAPQV